MNTPNGLNNITIKKSQLLEVLKKNRDEHRGYFNKALVGYREQFIEELERNLREAKAGKSFQRYIALNEPEDHTMDYERIVKMLEMSIHEEITLTQTEFAQYVQDDWAWKRDFITSNSRYLKG